MPEVKQTIETVEEFCPHCGSFVKLHMHFRKHFCPECQHLIKPCTLCPPTISDQGCESCPLGKDS